MSGRCNQFVRDHNAVVIKYACCLYFSANATAIRKCLEQSNPTDYANMCISCSDISYSFCTHCNEILCIAECSETEECYRCEVRYCLSCCRERVIEEKEATHCGCDCPALCSSCRLDICKNEYHSCVECKNLSFDVLLEECNAKQAQIDALRKEMETLTLSRSSDCTNADACE